MSKTAFDKYFYYSEAVQSPESDVEFLLDTYKKLSGGKPKVFREDFCAAFLNCCEWVKQGPNFEAIGIDLDPEPLAYGHDNYWSQLKPEQQQRVQWYRKNVLGKGLPKADIIAAMNFSYYIFKERSTILKYFKRCHQSLNKNGLFVVDCFGGSLTQESNEEHVKHQKFTYYWEQKSFNPLTYEGVFHIHFKLKGEKRRREKVFTYDWRMWTIPELQDLMKEAGFKKTTVYWEGTTRKGEGDGVFKPSTTGEECDAWIAYVVGKR